MDDPLSWVVGALQVLTELNPEKCSVRDHTNMGNDLGRNEGVSFFERV